MTDPGLCVHHCTRVERDDEPGVKPQDKSNDEPGDKSEDKLENEPEDEPEDEPENEPENEPESDYDDDSMAEFAPVLAALNFERLPHFASAVYRSKQQATGAEEKSDSDPSLTPMDCTFICPPLYGSYHIVFPLKFTDGTQWVLKVPSAGYAGHWSEISARSLRSEALTMQFLKRNTTIPIPDVYIFDASLDNELNCPFILMECIQGIPLHKVWFDETATPAFLEQCRKRALEDIAEAMVQLNKFSFNQCGSLSFDKEGNIIEISSMPFWDQSNTPVKTLQDFDMGEECEIGPFSDAKTYLQYSMNSRQPLGSITCRGSLMDDSMIGSYKLLRLFFDWIPAEFYDNNSGFVLSHLDFAIQNALVTEEGKLCGLIDWDGVSVGPRCIGCEKYPSWLTRDWDPVMYRYDPEDPIPNENSPEELAHYRSVYRRAMQRALAKPEAAYQHQTSEGVLSTIPKCDPFINVTHYSLIIDNLSIAANHSGLTMPLVQYIVDKIRQDTAGQWLDAAFDSDAENSIPLGLNPENEPEEFFQQPIDDFNFYEICSTLARGDLDEKRMYRLKEGFHALMKNPDSAYESGLTDEHGQEMNDGEALGPARNEN